MRSQPDRAAGVPGPPGRPWLGLAVLLLPTLVVASDISILFLALPHVSADLGASGLHQLWIGDIYGFMVAGLLVPMGALADRFGRRRVLTAGAVGFGLASVLSALAPDPGVLILARALMGVCGATLLPSTMGMIKEMFPDPAGMGKAIAVWGTAFMAGVALGPALGGLLLTGFSWRAVFLPALPAMAAVVFAGPSLLPPGAPADPAGSQPPASVDAVSVVLSMATVLSLVYGLKVAAIDGWTTPSLLSLLAGVLAGAAFVRRQGTLAEPLVDLRLLRQPVLAAALTISLLVGGLQAGTGLVASMGLQTVQGLSPLRAGLWLILPAVALTVGINVAPALAQRLSPGRVLAGGFVVAAAGQLVLAGLGPGSGVLHVVLGLSIAYAGVGPAAALLNHVVLDAAPPGKEGVTSSLSGTAGELGVAAGIAVLGTVATAVYGASLQLPAGLPTGSAAAAGDGVGPALAAAAGLPDGLREALTSAARSAFVDASSVVAAGCAMTLLIASAVSLVMVRARSDTAAPEVVDLGRDQAAPQAVEGCAAPADPGAGSAGSSTLSVRETPPRGNHPHRRTDDRVAQSARRYRGPGRGTEGH